MKLLENVKKMAGKNRNKILDLLDPKINPYESTIELNAVSEGAAHAAHNIRGRGRLPSLMVCGVTTRSGTNYVSNLIAQHPDIEACPNKIWEVPFLQHINHIVEFEDKFFRHKKLARNMGEHDFLALFGASFIGYMHSFIAEDKVMLTKVPNVEHLAYFPLVFPDERLILLLRDGRDVVFSTLKSWPTRNFAEVCQRWNDSARLILEFYAQNKNNDAYRLIKYENVLADPAKFIDETCKHYGLNSGKYPFDNLDNLPVIGSSVASQQDGKVNWKNVDKPKDFNPVGRWQSWTSHQKKTFKRIAGETLKAAGYCQDLAW